MFAPSLCVYRGISNKGYSRFFVYRRTHFNWIFTFYKLLAVDIQCTEKVVKLSQNDRKNVIL